MGLPRQVIYNGQIVTTTIFKDSIGQRVKIRKMNLEGDKQSDLKVHGGIEKAVYSYPMEHYGYWKNQYPKVDMPWGMFGENLTTEGLIEDCVNIGDLYQIGSSKLIATQPRIPCYKLGIKFGQMDIVKRFLTSLRPGIYFKVFQEGEVGSGDNIELVYQDKDSVTVHDIVRLYIDNDDDQDMETMERASRINALPEGWKIHFKHKITQLLDKR
ncbi:MAG: MOSC domain-containing protein [Thermoproteota archaeon]|nr:MOSC domain-containing protein [Thermoproteota archaeon]